MLWYKKNANKCFLLLKTRKDLADHGSDHI